MQSLNTGSGVFTGPLIYYEIKLMRIKNKNLNKNSKQSNRQKFT